MIHGSQMRISSFNSSIAKLTRSSRVKTPEQESQLLMMTSQVLSTSKRAKLSKLMLVRKLLLLRLKEGMVVMVLSPSSTRPKILMSPQTLLPRMLITKRLAEHLNSNMVKLRKKLLLRLSKRKMMKLGMKVSLFNLAMSLQKEPN